MDIQRIFIPGGEWIYFKLYTGTKTADHLLLEHVAPLIEKLKNLQAIDGFFFLRYSDPDFHLRLRLHLTHDTAYGIIFPEFYRLFDRCIQQDMIHKVVCDTYVREIERYGKQTMELSENLFHTDSKYMLEFFAHEEQTLSRWQYALLLIDDMLTVFGLDPQKKVELTARLSHSFKQEFGYESKHFTKHLNDKYRSLRSEIARVMNRREEPVIVTDHLLRRKNELALLADPIVRITASQSDITLESLLYSFLHMSLNRLFRSKNRLYEMVLYDFLRRYYESEMAREKHSRPKE